MAKMDGGDKLKDFAGCINSSRPLTDVHPEADLPTLVAHELTLSPALGGRSVQQGRKRPAHHAATRQMSPF